MFGTSCESLVTNSGAIPVLFQWNPVISAGIRGALKSTAFYFKKKYTLDITGGWK